MNATSVICIGIDVSKDESAIQYLSTSKISRAVAGSSLQFRF